jgi:hypothetical protein
MARRGVLGSWDWHYRCKRYGNMGFSRVLNMTIHMFGGLCIAVLGLIGVVFNQRIARTTLEFHQHIQRTLKLSGPLTPVPAMRLMYVGVGVVFLIFGTLLLFGLIQIGKKQ